MCEAGVARTLTNNTNRKQYHELQEARNRCLQRGYSVLCRRVSDKQCGYDLLRQRQHKMHVRPAEVKGATNPGRWGDSPHLLLTPSPCYTIDMDASNKSV